MKLIHGKCMFVGRERKNRKGEGGKEEGGEGRTERQTDRSMKVQRKKRSLNWAEGGAQT